MQHTAAELERQRQRAKGLTNRIQRIAAQLRAEGRDAEADELLGIRPADDDAVEDDDAEGQAESTP